MTNNIRWATIQEAAAEFRVSTRTIRRWIQYGELHGERFGPRLIRVDLDSMQPKVLDGQNS